MKYQPHRREKKALSATGLLGVVREIFVKIPRFVQRQKISLTDCLMSVLAMFGLKAPSLLSFDAPRLPTTVRNNLKALYKVNHPPSDTHMREVLDEIDPRALREVFLSVFHQVQRGKLLENYTFLNSYLCLVNGTEIFRSEKIQCKNCCKKEYKDGKVSYHHQMLGAVLAHPDRRQVLPLCPEPITKQDGATKNDCERNAFHRFLVDLKKRTPETQSNNLLRRPLRYGSSYQRTPIFRLPLYYCS